MKVLRENLHFFDVLYEEKEFIQFKEKLNMMIFVRRAMFSKIELRNMLNFDYVGWEENREDKVLRFYFSDYIDLTSKDKNNIIRKVEKGDLQFKIMNNSVFSIICEKKDFKELTENVIYKYIKEETLKSHKINYIYKSNKGVNIKIKIDRKNKQAVIVDIKYNESKNIYQNGINPKYNGNFTNLIHRDVTLYDNDCDFGPLNMDNIFYYTSSMRLKRIVENRK